MDEQASISAETYEVLRRIAHKYFSAQVDQTLQPTALVHEAFAKVAGSALDKVADPSHYIALATTAMRQVVVDYARAQLTQKRGGEWRRITMNDIHAERIDLESVIALSEAIEQLRNVDERRAKVVELSYFGGLTAEETSRAIDVSRATVERDLRGARAWLKAHLEG